MDDIDALVYSGLVARNLGKYREAEDTLLRALRLYAGPPDRPTRGVVEAQLGLATVFYAVNRYPEAEERALLAMRGAERLPEAERFVAARGKVTLADVYHRSGRLRDAERVARSAVAAFRKISPQQDLLLAIALHTLGRVHSEVLDEFAARSEFEEAREILERLGETDDQVYSHVLSSLAGTLTEVDPDAAVKYSERALRIVERAAGDRHPDTADATAALAAALEAAGDRDEARKMVTRAMEIYRSTHGRETQWFARALCNLGRLDRVEGKFSGSAALLRQALAIQRRVLGRRHPDVAATLHSLGVTLAGMDRSSEALTLLSQSLDIENDEITDVACFASDRQRAFFLATLQLTSHILLAVVARTGTPESVRIGLDSMMRRKALAIDVLATRHDAVVSGEYPQADAAFENWNEVRSTIAQLRVKARTSDDVNEHAGELADLEKLRDTLERGLAHVVPEIGLDARLRTVDHSSVVAALPPGAALVEFAAHFDYDFKAVEANGEESVRPPHYLALVAHAGKGGLHAIDLGSAREIDSMIASLVQGVSRGEHARHMGLGLEAAPRSALDPDETALAARLFDPLRPALGDCRRLFIAPDGDLARLPFEILPSKDGGRLIDEFQLSYLGTGRDLLRFEAVTAVKPDAPVVIADPDYDLGANGSPALGQRFERLPGAAREGEEVAAKLNVTPVAPDAALEGWVKRLRSPAILHLATHGFFEQDPDSSLLLKGEGVGDALLRSGLALAGANAAPVGDDLPADAEDGVLYAEDVTGMDLLATEMVVLSACETGLGDVQIGEGVHGLRRAFAIAGANTLVMSLWKVPDEATRELMVNFYDRVLAGEPRSEALRGAQLDLRERYDDPYFWGAFICHGDPGPIRTQVGARSA